MREQFDTISISLFWTINIKCSHYILLFPSPQLKCHTHRLNGEASVVHIVHSLECLLLKNRGCLFIFVTPASGMMLSPL